MTTQETYYEILKVERTATSSEISAAYQAAKAAFSKDSLATYSLFSQDETADLLKKIEEAYQTLSNVERKREYDRLLSGAATQEPIKAEPTLSIVEGSLPSSQSIVSNELHSAGPADLRDVREKRGLSYEDLARITKIPTRYLKAIEECDLKRLPARVYIQGFLKNLCAVYKLDPKGTVKSYLEHYDKLTRP